jgi:putative hydrolase of the HAD superfamily
VSDRALFFDVDGVVIHGFHARPEKRRRWDENLERDLGISPAEFSKRFIEGPFVQQVLTGRTSLVQALEAALPGLGFKGSPLRLTDYWLRRDSQQNDPLLEAIRDLRTAGARRLYLATNQEHLRASHLWTALGLQAYFEDIFYSARLGVLKPSRDFFERIERVIGPQNEPPLFFDDSEEVVRAAVAYGWEGVVFESVESCTRHPAIRALLDTNTGGSYLEPGRAINDQGADK